jgi:non-ribosomal peptide synthetase component E (peptide arylation enzyme)
VSGRPHTTDKHMTVDEIATKYPRAQRVAGSVVYRDVQPNRAFHRQVAPAMLEGVLLEHPDILDAAVMGMADDEHGEVPRASLWL